MYKYLIVIVIIIVIITSLKYNKKEKYKKMLKFAIYFPQFHCCPENDLNFYPGYTDMVNLSKLKYHKKETPSFKHLDISSMKDYDYVKNPNIIKKQIELIHKHNIDGFATYHYWFSENTITNNNIIMENINKKLLNSELGGKKIFYIWANEDWTQETSLTNSSSCRIKNKYTYKDIKKHCNYLIDIFKNPNYLKIDNKPVFFIHHSYEDKKIIWKKYKKILTKLCKKIGFNGIFLRLGDGGHRGINNLNRKGEIYYSLFNNINDYITEGKKFKILDYKRFVDNLKLQNNDVESIFFDFDNSARLVHKIKFKKPLKTINNYEKSFIKYLKKIKKNSPRILLLNAWNEWGEKMHIEPSNERGTYYLDLINKFL